MLAPPTPSESLATAAEFLRRKLASSAAVRARIGIVLGSGLGAFANQLRDAFSISYRDIPYFPASSVPGHEGRLVAGLLHGIPTIVLQGRVHGYEGYATDQVVFHMRTLGMLGVQAVVLTNAAGGIRLDMHPSQLVLISDHINLTGRNPAGRHLKATDRGRSDLEPRPSRQPSSPRAPSRSRWGPGSLT